ncbi:hypothetical protein ASD28_10420 [Massilia sp. Root133]|jgi:ZIP family zinc transporter|uniref:Uncharacterized protein n=1 Tax=Massilia cellulosiltytica TaxID=2683234 RepID=A0A7X3G6D8_9BURK|nr:MULTISPECIES: hypothetical protein [Telluria group]KQY00801.1 hypothetical protein ASD28_10420 [Massilia sp. Root133]KQZ53167.1 hypothetical protein ASD92_14200 [Massilia sp. Root1485]MVW63552.1 hypothetical protein [Telluria cellulosilytica]
MQRIPMWAQAGFWGLVAGYKFDVPRRLIAAIMAFGSGVLISALSFELIAEAYDRGGFNSMAVRFLGGAAVYTVANWVLSRKGAILAMLVDTMIPEAFEVAHDFAGLITVAGFLAAFALGKLGG